MHQVQEATCGTQEHSDNLQETSGDQNTTVQLLPAHPWHLKHTAQSSHHGGVIKALLCGVWWVHPFGMKSSWHRQ